MADWSSHNITLTAKGASALSKVQAGSGSLTITRVIASEQYVAESTLREVTSLSVENLPLTIIDRHEVQDGGSVIQVQLSNLYLGNAFTLNEIGVFATHSDNPSEEFLYIIAQVDADTGDKIPVYATTPVTATYDIYLYNVGADNVEITISSAGLVTYEALNKACDIIQRNTAYEVGDILHGPSLKKGLAIKCTVAGTTKSTDIDLSHKNVGDTVKDGGVTWTVVKYALTTDVPPLASALAAPRKIELTGNVTGSADFDGSRDIQIATSLSDAYLPLAGGEVTGAVNFKGGATGNWTGTVGGGHVAFEDTITKYYDSKQDQNNDFVFACNAYNAPMFLVSVVTFIYRNTGSSQSIRNFGVVTRLPSGWDYPWLYSKEYHNFIDYIGSTYAITAKSAAPLTINVSFKAQSQDTATAHAYTRVWVKLIGE